MNDLKPWEYTCKTCGDHNLTVTRIWTILAGLASERWQEWGPLEADHHWHYEFKERVEENPDDEVERGDFGEYAEDDSASEPEEYEMFETENNPEPRYDEAMKTIQLGGTDWNDAVKAYNTRRAQIKGEIVARVSAYFGFDLPVTFPFYQGGNAGQPVQNPLATPIP